LPNNVSAVETTSTQAPERESKCHPKKNLNKSKFDLKRFLTCRSRDRNREHAKNTRLRKKAYISKLKELVDQLTHQKSLEVRDRISLGKKIYDTVCSPPLLSAADSSSSVASLAEECRHPVLELSGDQCPGPH
jgi:hypothetical protein